ncbi:hypothetical protein BH10CYA1_BH10CYA1_63760 [soil metagenome]
MTNTTKDTTDVEQRFLQAAKILGAHQLEQLQTIDSIEGARMRVEQLAEELRKTEYLVARSDVQIAQMKLHVLDNTLTANAMNAKGTSLADELNRSREQLWASASFTADSQVLNAAFIYSKAMRNLQAYYEYRAKVVGGLNDYMKDLEKVQAEHTILLEKQEATADSLKAAHAAFADISYKALLYFKTCDLERNLVNLAHELTGIEAANFLYDFVETKDLPIARAQVFSVE